MRLIVALATLLASVTLFSPASAQTIYPLGRADILAGSKFDFKVEFPSVVKHSELKITINGEPYSSVFAQPSEFIESENGKDGSSLILRGVTLTKPGVYSVIASDGKATKSVQWTVFTTPEKPVAKNVILFIGDGFALGARTAARVMSKGLQDGKYNGKLAMDDMPYMALLATQGTDSIVTDSANSASAYTTGHKSCVNALGVYCSRALNTLDHPKVETITSLAKKRGLAVGVVTNAEIEDATPASMVAHTRRRSDYNDIVEMFYDSKIDVMMGGGSPNFLPKSASGSKRQDEKNYLEMFKAAGFQYATNKAEMEAAAAQSTTTKLLGLYNTGNMDGALDLKFLKKGSVSKFPNQPDLPEEMMAAIKVLSRNKDGFVLMVESALIDKYAHVMDSDRAIFDVIMLDNAVRKAKEWAKANGDNTLILVTADHTQPVSVIGTVDDEVVGDEMRQKVGTYAESRFPNYPTPNTEGYPEKIDVSRRLRVAIGAYPDYYDTFRPHMDGPFVPAVKNDAGVIVANEKYKDVPGAVHRVGNIPNKGAGSSLQSVHSADDVILTAIGPGADKVRGQMENTELFRIMADALALSPVRSSK